MHYTRYIRRGIVRTIGCPCFVTYLFCASVIIIIIYNILLLLILCIARRVQQLKTFSHEPIENRHVRTYYVVANIRVQKPFVVRRRHHYTTEVATSRTRGLRRLVFRPSSDSAASIPITESWL